MPDISSEEKNALLEVLESTILSIGPKVEEFEKRICDYIGCKYSVAVNSGTSALSLIMKYITKKYSIKNNDLFITTPFSFVTSSNIILYEGAMPLFADINEENYNMDLDSLKTVFENYEDKKNIRGIVGVDVFGQPLDWNILTDFAQKKDLILIEDSCEAIGAEYLGKKCGNFGVAGAFAFYPNKQMTTGEGGIVVTNNEELYLYAKSLRNQGRGITENWLEHVNLGYNYRLSEIPCALGIEQLKKLDSFLEKRSQVASRYQKLFSKIDGIEVPKIENYTNKMSWFVYVIKLDRKINRDGVMNYLNQNGIGCRNYFFPIHLQPYYKERFGFKEGMLPVTEDVSKRTIAIPFYNNLSLENQEIVAQTLKKAIAQFS